MVDLARMGRDDCPAATANDEVTNATVSKNRQRDQRPEFRRAIRANATSGGSPRRAR